VQTLTGTLAQAWKVLLGARLEWVAAALFLYCLAWLAASGRWRVIVHALGGRISWGTASLATIAGVFVNNVTPTGRLGGEACRIAITRLKVSSRCREERWPPCATGRPTCRSWPFSRWWRFPPFLR